MTYSTYDTLAALNRNIPWTDVTTHSLAQHETRLQDTARDLDTANRKCKQERKHDEKVYDEKA